MTRDSKPDNTKDNEQETKSEKGQVEAINEELVVDDNAPVDEINKVKDSVPIDLKAKLTKEEENAPGDERQSCSSPGGDRTPAVLRPLALIDTISSLIWFMLSF